MKRFLFVAIVGLPLLLTACQAGPAPTPTETATSEPIIEPTDIPTLPPTWTPTPQPSPTPADTPTPAATPTPVPNDVWVDAANGLNLRAEAKADALGNSREPRGDGRSGRAVQNINSAKLVSPQ